MKKSFLYALLLIFITTVHAKALECPDMRNKGDEPIDFSFSRSSESLESIEQDHTVWFKHHEVLQKNEGILLKFGRTNSTGYFEPLYELVLRNKGKILQYIFQTVKKHKYIDARIPLKWLNVQDWTWTTCSLTNSVFALHFQNENQTLDIQLDGLKIESVQTVRISGAVNLTASTKCMTIEDIETTTETTPVPVESSTTSTTAATTIPADTSTILVITTQTANTTNSSETSISNEDDAYTDVTEVTENTVINSTGGPSLDVVPVAVKEDVDEKDCTRLPVWAWACVGIMAASVLFFVILLIYIMILKRRYWALKASVSQQGDYLRGHVSTSGYGQQARDMQFLKTRSDSVVAIAPLPSAPPLSQTLRSATPRNPITPDVCFYTSPRASVYSRSTSCPGPQDPSLSISFPPPPSTPPPEKRPETVPLFCPNGTDDDDRRTYNKGRQSNRRTSSKRRTRRKECVDADDESSLSN